MAKLYILIGNIGSGKSTWTKKNHKGKLVLSRDNLRYMLGCGDYLFDFGLEPYVFEAEKKLLSIFLRTNRDIIIDEVGISKKSRGPYIRIANQYGYEIIAVQLPKFSKEICVNRRMKHEHRGYKKEIWEQVWDKFNKRYEPPTLEEGFSQIKKVSTICPTLKQKID